MVGLIHPKGEGVTEIYFFGGEGGGATRLTGLIIDVKSIEGRTMTES